MSDHSFSEHGPDPWPPKKPDTKNVCWCGAKSGEACFVMPGPDGKRRKDGKFARRTSPHRQRSSR